MTAGGRRRVGVCSAPLLDPADENDLDAIYARLRGGDVRAGTALIEAAVAALPAVMATAGVAGDAGRLAAWDSVVDALLKLTGGRSNYDPSRGKLFSYLVMEVRGDVRNARRGERRRKARQAKAARENAPVADGGSAGEDPVEAAEWQAVRLAEAEAAVGAADRPFLRAVAAGADAAALAEVLGVGHLDEIGRKKAIKKVRDRVRIKLKRAGLIGGEANGDE